MRQLKFCLLAAAVAASVSSPLFAAEDSVEQRLQRMERLLSSQSLLDMSQRIDALQSEVQQLRGQIEEQKHTIEGLKNRQRELYLDIDRRLTLFEREGEAPMQPTGAEAKDTQAPSSGKTANDEQHLQQEREAYQNAFDMLRELRYAQATAAFRSFLKEYPDGKYAQIAQYWLGEASYAQRKFKQAVSDYEALLQNYPNSPKRAEAMLKIGYSYYELQQMEQATGILKQLIEEYPDSTEAGQARSLLKQIRKKTG